MKKIALLIAANIRALGCAFASDKPPHKSPETKITEVFVNVESRKFLELNSTDGYLVTIEQITYSNGSKIYFPTKIIKDLNKQEKVTKNEPFAITQEFKGKEIPSQEHLPLEITILDEIQPPNGLTAENPQQVQKPPIFLYNFAPVPPFRVRLEQARGFSAESVFQLPRDQWTHNTPNCEGGSWQGFAKYHFPQNTLQTTKTWIEKWLPANDLVFFPLGGFVCVSFDETLPNN